jgi:hypothetical protein
MNGNAPDRLAHANVRLILETYLDKHHPDTSYPWLTDPKNVEVGVAAELYVTKLCFCGHDEDAHDKFTDPHEGFCDACDCTSFQNKLVHVGVLDILGTSRSTGDLCPVDHKSCSQLNARFVHQYEMDSQLSGYMWQASQLMRKPCHTAFINAIEIGVVPSSNRKCPAHGVEYAECGPEHIKFQIIGPIERTDRQIEEWRAGAIALALKYRQLLTHTHKSIHKVRMEGTFNGSCAYCEFREWCIADRPSKQVDKMFTQRPWKPWERVRSVVKKPDPHTLYVDNSTLKTAASCSTQALMRYGLGWSSTEQHGPLNTGTAVHKGLEVWFKGSSNTQALDAFDEIYQEQT